MIFVWVRNLANQPVSQLWPADLPHEKERVLAKHVLQANEECLSFDQLGRLYPPPAPKEAKA